jgi:hypothetical protein
MLDNIVPDLLLFAIRRSSFTLAGGRNNIILKMHLYGGISGTKTTKDQHQE